MGNEKSPLVFVGEGPGADEDAQGIPFVGRAGQLLTQMIENTARKEGIPLRREDVYICNVVKCRPPGNRTPEPDEMEICGQFLFRQLTTIQPKAICALGGTAARALTGHKEGVTKMRGKWFEWRNIPVMVTYHPSYLLRPYNQERQARSVGGPEEGAALRLRLACFAPPRSEAGGTLRPRWRRVSRPLLPRAGGGECPVRGGPLPAL